jgi:hypothetical protein
MTDSRAVLTIATGKKAFVDMAVNLARSFLWWHRQSDIQFQLVTDQKHLIPSDIIGLIQIIEINEGELGEGFSTKLYLDKLAGDGQTLFIDSDCLVFGNLDWVFERFKNHSVSVVGGYISNGEWFGNIASICKQFNVPHIPKFNGGIYYLEKNEISTAVYQTARELEKKYDEIGFVRLRNKPNDEVLMALAMQLHKQQPILDVGMILSDPQACPGGYKIDVINGSCLLINPPAPHKLHQSWYPFEKVSPVIFHFLGYYTEHYPYKMNAFLLKKAIDNKLNINYRLYGLLTIVYPQQLKKMLKNLMRPAYRLLFGIRAVKTDIRSNTDTAFYK